MEWLSQEIGSILVSAGISFFCGLLGKVRMWRLKRQLLRAFEDRILKKYGTEVFYNDLSNYLARTHLISQTINNCFDCSVWHYRSQSKFISHYLGVFIEQYPQHAHHRGRIEYLIHECFEIVFDTLNQAKDENVRQISNVAKELAGELGQKIDAVNNMLVDMQQDITKLVECQVLPPAHFDYYRYAEYIANTYISLCTNDYVPRQIHSTDNRSVGNSETPADTNTYVVATTNHQSLLLADGGYGKTYEALTLLYNLCKNSDERIFIPVYLPLMEYGLLYTSIIDGITQKTAPFCEGKAAELLTGYLKEGKLFIILDGIDDIPASLDRTRFIADLRNLSQTYDACHFFVTARANRYRNELSNFDTYTLVGYGHDAIQSRLRKEGIHSQLPANYFELFKNPLFFEAGIVVLKNSPHSDLLNRSTLLEKLIHLLYQDWNQQKGLSTTPLLCCADFISLIGQFAYESFDVPYYRHTDFEQRIAALDPNIPAPQVIDATLASDLFKTAHYLTFTHKLFKEFCVAFYLHHQLPFLSNYELYHSKVNEEEWKEVFILLSGLFTDMEQQDAFLDFVMQENLPLYLDCVKAKGEPYEQIAEMPPEKIAFRFMTQLISTYKYIVSTYFLPIVSQFDPRLDRDHDTDSIICIRGVLSPDGKSLRYRLDRFPVGSPEVLLTPAAKATEYDAAYQQQLYRRRTRFVTRCAALNQAADSGRQTALEIIRSELKTILKERRLYESRYILCERVTKSKNQIKHLIACSDYEEMKAFVDADIQRVLKQCPSVEGYQHGKVDMLNFQALLSYLCSLSAKYVEDVLPGWDRDMAGRRSCMVWDLYSDEQKVELIKKFFYFHQISYMEMVETNFPRLFPLFSRYRNAPYQMIVHLDLKKNAPQGTYTSGPEIQYYYIATSSPTIEEPQVSITDDFIPADDVFATIQSSYQQRGRTLHSVSVTSSMFSMLTSTHDQSSSGPLMEYVYQSIKSSLEEIWGRL